MQHPLDFDWEFIRGKTPRSWLRFECDGPAELVRLPHCWNTTDTFQEDTPYYRGKGSYRNRFQLEADSIDPEKTRWFLCSHGFFGTGEVWLNGNRAGRFDGQFLGLRMDITAWFRPYEQNELAIQLTNKCSKDTLPGIDFPDFILHGGLVGGLWLEQAHPIHLKHPGSRVILTHAEQEQAKGLLELQVENTTEKNREFQVDWSLRAPDGTLLSQKPQRFSVAPLSLNRIEVPFVVDHPQRWDIEAPQLYELDLKIRDYGQIFDTWTQRFGIRKAEFKPDKGFFLNDRRVPIRGINRHENMPGFGSALPLSQHWEDARLIKEYGLNAVRLSHYPQHPAFLDACDELGILVYAEIASWKSVRGGGWLKKALRQMEGMILRDGHHPSVILWGMGNEGQHHQAYTKLHEQIRKLDPYRASVYAENHQYRAKRKGTQGIPDVMGVNYEFDALDEAYATSRNNVVVISEMSNCPRWRGDITGEMEQLRVLQQDLAALENKPWIAGWFLWCLTDYATMRKKRYRRPSGFFDAWRQPKLAAYYLREHFAGKPMPTLFTHYSGEQIHIKPDGEGCYRIQLTNQEGHVNTTWNGHLGYDQLTGTYHPDDHILISRGEGRVWTTLPPKHWGKPTLKRTAMPTGN